MYLSLYAVVLTLIAVIFLIFFKSIKRLCRVWYLARQFPGPKCWPLVGNAYIFFGCKGDEVYQIVEKCWLYYGKTMKFWFGLEFSVFAGDTKDVEFVLGTTHLLTKSMEYKYLRNWLNEGLLISLPKKWFKRRRVLTPAFHFQILGEFVEVFDRTSHVFVKNLEKASKQHDDGVFELNKLVSLATLDVICGELKF